MEDQLDHEAYAGLHCPHNKNWHRTRGEWGHSHKFFKPDNGTQSGEQRFREGMRKLNDIAKEAKANKGRVRAYGSRWSLNSIAFTKSYLINSAGLDYHKIGIDKDQLVSKDPNEARRLVFVQCGVSVKELNTELQNVGLALPTSGASDGQRFIGAVSTGTHGSANSVGAMQEYIKGIHLVLGRDQHVFIQKSNPVVNDKFGQWLGDTEMKNDDDLFNAAVVSFGSWGLVHGLLIEVEESYSLKMAVRKYKFSEVVDAITKLNMAGLKLPEGDALPFHFEAVLNPLTVPIEETDVYVRAIYKVAPDVPANQMTETPKAGYNLHFGVTNLIESVHEDQEEDFKKEDLLRFSEETIDELGGHRRKFYQWAIDKVLAKEFPLTTPEEEQKKFYPGKLFSSNNKLKCELSHIPFVKGTSLEIGVPFERVEDALRKVVETAEKHPFGAPLAFRYVKCSGATLAFTRNLIDPSPSNITVTMEMPGWDDPINDAKQGHEAIFEALAGSGIPHSFHWGQQFPKNKTWVANSYGTALKQWLDQRNEFLDEEEIHLFSNKSMDEIGLGS